MLLKLVLACSVLWTAIALSCGGGKTASDASVTPPSSASAEATQAQTSAPRTPEASPGADGTVPAETLRVGAPVPLPENVALIVEVGCWQCDGDYGKLVRIYRDASGALQETPLLDPPGGHAVSPDGSQVAFWWCSRGICDGFNPTSPDVQSTISWSHDGGITATAYAPIDGDYYVAAVLRGMLLARGQTADGQALPLRRYPGGDTLTPPPGGVYPIATGWDVLEFLTADRGRILLGPDVAPFDLGPGRQINSIAPADVGGDRFAVDWSEHVTDTDARFYKSIVSLTGPRLHMEIERTFLVDGFLGQSGGWLDADTIIATYNFHDADLPAPAGSPDSRGSRPLPAVIDLKTSTVHPIVEPFASSPAYQHGRNFVLGVVRGPFARVVNTGSCLNLRTEPRADAPVLACAADSVLLRWVGQEEKSADGQNWALVAMPEGDDGWVSPEFIAR
jgi:hypothetical protein